MPSRGTLAGVVLDDPIPADLARLLRRAVLDLARSEYRRHVPALFHIGTPGGPAVSVSGDTAWDHGVRTDVVAAIVRRLGGRAPLHWVTRGGPLAVEDVDAAWLAAATAAAAERGDDATFVVVTRHGWLDPRSCRRQEWKRIRQR